MCQPKPGPRCSSHARTAMQAARHALDAATANAVHVNPDCADATLQAQAELDAAQHAYNHARYDWESTPEGQQKLAHTTEAFRASGDNANALLHERRLRIAWETRQHQLRALELHQQANQLRDASAWPAAQQRLAEAEARMGRAQAAWQQVTSGDDPDGFAAARDEWQAAQANLRTAQARAHEADDRRIAAAAHRATADAAWTRYGDRDACRDHEGMQAAMEAWRRAQTYSQAIDRLRTAETSARAADRAWAAVANSDDQQKVNDAARTWHRTRNELDAAADHAAQAEAAVTRAAKPNPAPVGDRPLSTV